MTPEHFVAAIRDSILERNLAEYKKLLGSPDSEVEDEYWRKTCRLYKSLDATRKGDLVSVMRQVMVDTVSSMLGILDGTTYFQRDSKGFTLKYGSDAEKLNGDLQDFFLAAEEDSGGS